MAKKFSLNPKEIKAAAPKELKKDISEILSKIPEKDLVFGDANWSKSPKAMWEIKTSLKNVEKIKSEYDYGKWDIKGKYDLSVNGYKVRFTVSGKSSTKSADANTTRMQELGSAWIIRRAINDNVLYRDWMDIVKDEKFDELVELYPDVVDDTEWLQGYYAQQKRMLEEFANTKFTEYNREGGFMDYISELVKNKFGISKKDTWNPADIWLIQNTREVEKIIDDNVSGSKASQTILELNAVLRKLFQERKVVGISLKKISGKIAHYEEYNVDDKSLGVNDDYNFSIDDMKLDLTFNGDSFGTQDSRIFVKAEDTVYNFQIKGNDSTKFSNLKFEPTAKGAAAARMGKSPIDMVQQLMRDNRANFEFSNAHYPKTVKDFESRQNEFVKMFNVIKKDVDTGIHNDKDFVNNIKNGLASPKPYIANSKLMQLAFLYVVVKMPKKKREEFMTDMVFIAAKKGTRFGPFGKLY